MARVGLESESHQPMVRMWANHGESELCITCLFTEGSNGTSPLQLPALTSSSEMGSPSPLCPGTMITLLGCPTGMKRYPHHMPWGARRDLPVVQRRVSVGAGGWRRSARHHGADQGEGRLSTCPLLGVGSTQGYPSPTPKAHQLDQSNLQKSYRESQVTPPQEVRVEPTSKAPSV